MEVMISHWYWIVQDIIDNGAALLTEVYGIQYFYKDQPLMDIQNLYVIPDVAGD